MTTILVVDDNETNRYLIRTILSAAGYTVIAAEHGDAALVLARAHPPDLIISDVLMPVMDGYALRRACLHDAQLTKIPFIFYTATFLDPQNEQLGIQLGAARYITGPVDNHTLLDHVDAVLHCTPEHSAVAAENLADEDSFYRLYNEVLIQKLEDKMQDLTLANQQLREREQFVTNILDGLSAHIAILAADGAILAVNQAWRAFAAANPPVTANVCEGANYLTVCDDAARKGVLEAAQLGSAIRSVLAGEQESAELEYACHSPSERRWFTARVTRFLGDAHARVIVAHENITHRVQAEQALRVSESALRRSQEVAHVGHWTWDTRTNTVTWSDEMKRIFGLDPAQFDGDLNVVIERVIHPDDRAHVFAMNEAVVRDAQPAGTEYRVVWSDGQVRTVWAQPGDRDVDAAGQIVRLSGVVQDITERKYIESELAASVQRLSLAARAARLGIWEANFDSGVEVWDDSMYEIYGVTRGVFAPTQAAWRSLIHPDDLPRLIVAEQAAIERGTRMHNIFRIVHPGGAVRWIESDAEVLCDAGGRPQRLVGVNRDVTATVESEQRQRLHSAALEAAANGIVITNRDGIIESVNPAFALLTGYSPAEAIGKNPRDLVRSGRQTQSFYKRMWQMILAGNIWRGELVNRRKDGSLYHEEQTITPVRDQDGEITHFIGIKQDISARVREEHERTELLAQVQAQADQLVQIMRSVPEGVVLLDAACGIVQANPQAKTYLHRLLPGAHGGPLTQIGDQLLEDILTPPPAGGWHLVRAQEEEFEVAAQPVAAGPLAAGWVLVLRNVTEHRALHRQLQRQERMAAVGQLAAGIAHDFNNIMSVIITYAQLLGETPALGERERSQLSTIHDQAMRATQMIRQILDFSRRSVMERHTFDLLPLLKEQHKLLAQTLPENIEIRLTYDQAEHIIHADPTRMQQMLVNLAVNARDAMPEGGVLHMELHRVHIEATAPPVPTMLAGDWLRLRISDTGVGMAPGVISHIFEPFFTTKAPGKGTGLGLAQVHGIVAQHEGHITVESAPGVGTTFSIYFPAIEVLSSNGVAVSSTITVNLPHGRGEMVLVVEDEDVVRRAVVDLLEVLRYRTCEASNGSDALQMLQTQVDTIDLVMSDVVMPKLGGLGLLQAMRQRGHSVPLILLTGHPIGLELADLKAQGLSAWLVKPPPLKDLAETIAHVLRSARHT